jgi:hypothetical protein
MVKQTTILIEKLIAIFCEIDDFYKNYEKYCAQHQISDGKSNRGPKSEMCLSEIITILVAFHLFHYRNFKWYYNDCVCGTLKGYFPALSYNRFIEIMKSAFVPLILYLTKIKIGKCSGLNFMDSTKLSVCHNKRIYSHKVFKGLAARGKTSTGWFFGFKLHLIINEKGEILSFFLTPGNTDDRNWKTISKLTKNIFGKIFADKGYISNNLFKKLKEKGISLITGIKKNMKNKLVEMQDKFLLRKRGVIESVNNYLKNVCQIEHSRHRSPINFVINLLSGLVAYSFNTNKPSILFQSKHLITA